MMLKVNFLVVFGNLSSLAYLVLMRNNFEGCIPSKLSQLTNLIRHQHAGNMLSDTFPSSLYNLSTFITLLSVTNNELHGCFSTNIRLSFPNMQWLSVRGNCFTGVISVSLSNSAKLLLFDVTQNELTRIVPKDIGNLQSFQYLYVGLNSFGSGKTNNLNFLNSTINCKSNFLTISWNLAFLQRTKTTKIRSSLNFMTLRLTKSHNYYNFPYDPISEFKTWNHPVTNQNP
jgi:hypothetical protein